MKPTLNKLGWPGTLVLLAMTGAGALLALNPSRTRAEAPANLPPTPTMDDPGNAPNGWGRRFHPMADRQDGMDDEVVANDGPPQRPGMRDGGNDDGPPPPPRRQRHRPMGDMGQMGGGCPCCRGMMPPPPPDGRMDDGNQSGPPRRSHSHRPPMGDAPPNGSDNQ